MFCDMYLIPYKFVDAKEIKFPKNYQKKFKSFKTGDDVLIAYAETMIVLQRWTKLYKKSKKHNELTKKILVIKKQLETECFTTPRQSILFHSESMTDQFNYIYYLLIKSYKELEK